DPSTLLDESIGLVRGYTYPESLGEIIAKAGMRVEYAWDDLRNLRLLVAGRVDFIVADYLSTLALAKREEFAVRPLRPNHSVDLLYPAFSRDDAAKQKKFEAALRDMTATGIIDKIYREQLGVSLSELLSSP
ncbi:MAG: hypothetical protein DWQ08_12060, partial [Proteobacteria bacterium]